MIGTFAFTKLVVNDLDVVSRFYCTVFGMTPLHRTSTRDHQYALDEIILSFPGASDHHRLIVTRYSDRACPPSGAAWTGFVVGDIDATLAAIRECGGAIEVASHENAEHKVVAAIAADPEGHLIEVIQHMRP